MAFNLFPKPPIKRKPGEAKPPEPKAQPVPGSRPVARSVSARELAASVKARSSGAAQRGANEAGAAEREITLTGPHSMVEWSPAGNKKIQVAEANPGLCADLENAALHYANGQAPQAREVLETGIVNDDDTKNSPLAWLALFDLLQRAGDRAASAAASAKTPACRRSAVHAPLPIYRSIRRNRRRRGALPEEHARRDLPMPALSVRTPPRSATQAGRTRLDHPRAAAGRRAPAMPVASSWCHRR
jgi:hypothetical protein